MKVIIAGSRTFNNYQLLKDYCNIILQNQSNITIVTGLAKGADLLGKRFAEEHNYKLAEFPADWDKYGKAAGFKRNIEMAEYADALIAFNLNNSKGTMHMINTARKYNLEIRIFHFNENYLKILKE